MPGIAPVGGLAQVEITRLVRRKLQILGSFGGRPRHDLAALMRLAVEGRLNIDKAIGERVPLSQATDAYRRLAKGQITGRAIVVL
jgi:S-(hydroxymethyl)glutathione dehydrogenase/alcohol dehydrogenase